MNELSQLATLVSFRQNDERRGPFAGFGSFSEGARRRILVVSLAGYVSTLPDRTPGAAVVESKGSAKARDETICCLLHGFA